MVRRRGELLSWDGLSKPLTGTARTQIAAVNAKIAVPATPERTGSYDIVQEVSLVSGQGMQTR